MRACGGLVLGDPEVDGFLARTRTAAVARGIVHESLSAQQIRERFPMFAADPRIEGYYEPDAGYVVPERAISVQLDLAGAAGATLLLGETVQSWSSTGASAGGGGVTVRTDARTLRAGRLVLCAGAWIAGLAPELSDVFTVYRQVLHWFPIREGYRSFAEMPVFIWDLGQARDGNSHPPSLYGFPAIDGPDGGVKIGFESYEHPLGPGGPAAAPQPAEALDAHARLIAANIPWLGAAALRSAACLYTSTASGDFVIDRHPTHESVVIVSPCFGTWLQAFSRDRRGCRTADRRRCTDRRSDSVSPAVAGGPSTAVTTPRRTRCRRPAAPARPRVRGSSRGPDRLTPARPRALPASAWRRTPRRCRRWARACALPGP